MNEGNEAINRVIKRVNIRGAKMEVAETAKRVLGDELLRNVAFLLLLAGIFAGIASIAYCV